MSLEIIHRGLTTEDRVTGMSGRISNLDAFSRPERYMKRPTLAQPSQSNYDANIYR